MPAHRESSGMRRGASRYVRCSRETLTMHTDGSARGAQMNGWPSSLSSRSRLRMTLSLSASPWPSGDDELAQRTEAQAERRLELNPGVKSLAAVAAHARGIA